MKLELDHDFIINIEDEEKIGKECAADCMDPVNTGIVVKMDCMENKGWQMPEICDSKVGKISSYQEYWLNKCCKAHTFAQKDDFGVVQVFRVAETVNQFLTDCRRKQIPLIDEELLTDCIRAIAEVHSNWIPAADDRIFHINIYVIETSGMNDTQFQLLISAELRSESEFSVCLHSDREKGQLIDSCSNDTEKIGLKLYGDEDFLGNCSNAAVFICVNGKVITPAAPLGSGIYSDLMRDSIISMLRDSGITVIERQITVDECIGASKIGSIDEIFVAGIEKGIQFVSELRYKDRTLASADASLTALLREILTDLMRGRQEDWHHWVIFCNKHH